MNFWAYWLSHMGRGCCFSALLMPLKTRTFQRMFQRKFLCVCNKQQKHTDFASITHSGLLHLHPTLLKPRWRNDLMRTLTLTLPLLNPFASRDSRVDVVGVCCDPTRPLHPQSNRVWQRKMSQGTKQADKPRRFRRGTRLFRRFVMKMAKIDQSRRNRIGRWCL